MNNLVFEQQYMVTFTHDVFNKRILREAWHNANGQLERPGDLPAVTAFRSETGAATARQWYSKGVHHRESGPAWEWIDADTGNLTREYWYRFGKLHRDDNLPAQTFWDEHGRIQSEKYYREGALSRSNGPALVIYNAEAARVKHSEWWIDGIRIRKVDFKANVFSP